MGIRVIDTDVWSYLYKGRSEAKLYEPHLFGNILVISFQTQAELLRGAMAANWGVQRRRILSRVCRNTLLNLLHTGYLYAGLPRWIVQNVEDNRSVQLMLGLQPPHYISACH